MKKIIILSALALVALASCTKNEISVNAIPDQEISYQVVATKGATALGIDKAFYTYAFLENVKDKAWAALAETDYDSYITDSKIVYNSTANKWANAKTVYYWPKDKESSLAFYSWRDNTIDKDSSAANDKLGINVSCTAKDGITFTNYEVEENYTRNKDIQVADKQVDQKKNTAVSGEPSRSWTSGVPTVFRHKLSTFVINVKSKEKYQNVTFFIKSVDFNKVVKKGTYKQNATATEAWTVSTDQDDVRNYRMFTAENVNGEIVTTTADVYGTKLLGTNTTGFKLTPSTLAGGGDFTILMPQTFEDNADVNVTVKYDIITNFTGTPVREQVEISAKLSEIFSANWEIGKKYVVNIIIGLDEILWDPIVEEWVDGTTAPMNI